MVTVSSVGTHLPTTSPPRSHHGQRESAGLIVLIVIHVSQLIYPYKVPHSTDNLLYPSLNRVTVILEQIDQISTKVTPWILLGFTSDKDILFLQTEHRTRLTVEPSAFDCHARWGESR